MSAINTTQDMPGEFKSTDPTYQRRVRAWSFYDWADHAYITVLSTTFFPPYFIAIAAPAFLVASQTGTNPNAIARDNASNVFAFAVSLALFLAALLAPVLGTLADLTGRRKRFLLIATAFGGVISSFMFTLSTGTWIAGLLMFIVTQIALNIALGLNSSLLPHVAHPQDMNRVSSLGYAMGYIGGGLLLLLNTILYLFAGKLGLDSATAVRIAFLTTGIWWIVFMIPVALLVPEPPATPLVNGTGSPIRDTLIRLRHTFRDIQHYRELFKMLIAFWLYSEGIGAIILLSTAYGAALGLDTSALIGALLMTQFVAFPYALVYGRISNQSNGSRSAYVAMLLWTAVTLPVIGLFVNLSGGIGLPLTFGLIALNQVLGIVFAHFVGSKILADFTARLDTKRAVLLGLAIYIIVPIWGFFIKSSAEFFMIGYLVGTVQGGTQALSRAIYTRLCPPAKSGEFFGLYGLSEKFAGILGPLLYGIVGTLTHSPQASILSICVFFLVGMFALRRVNETVGAKIAQEEELAIETRHAAE